MTTLLLLSAASTWALVGLIWTIQGLHYPLMARVAAVDFAAFHAAHTRGITPLVGPLMGVEAVTAVARVLAPPAGVPRGPFEAALLCVVVAAAATAFLSVPLHRRLGRGHDPAALRRLVATNWIRTIAWSARGLLMGAALFRLLRAA